MTTDPLDVFASIERTLRAAKEILPSTDSVLAERLRSEGIFGCDLWRLRAQLEAVRRACANIVARGQG